jgi:hypothetical protein
MNVIEEILVKAVKAYFTTDNVSSLVGVTLGAVSTALPTKYKEILTDPLFETALKTAIDEYIKSL